MKLTEPITVGTNKEGKRIYIKRPCRKFESIASYQEAFIAEARQGTTWSHPNLLSYIGLQKDDKGIFIALEYLPATPLNKALLDAVLHINTASESGRIMNQLMNAIAYLHSRNICHLNLRPENIYITKNSHDVRLANPGNTYAGCSPSFFIYKEQYTAPELFNEIDTPPTAASDIYSLGKVMEYLYSYSHLSYGISRVISKATQTDPAKRYANVQEMQRAFNRCRQIDWSIRATKGIAAISFIALIYYGLRDEPVSTETLQFIEDTTLRTRQAQAEAARAEELNTGISDLLTIPSDTVRRIPANDTLQFDAEEHQRLAEQIFKKEFRKRAEKIIAGMYTPQRMNVSEDIFQKQNLDGFSQLNQIQKELAEQFNMDFILTTRLSSEIISELTTESMKKLNKMGDED